MSYGFVYFEYSDKFYCLMLNHISQFERMYVIVKGDLESSPQESDMNLF